MKNKKSTVSIDIMIYLALGVFVLLILVFIVPRLIGKGGAEASQGLEDTKDYDGDGVVNAFDKCKCISADTANGCRAGTKTDVKGFCQYEGCSGELKKKYCP